MTLGWPGVFEDAHRGLEEVWGAHHAGRTGHCEDSEGEEEGASVHPHVVSCGVCQQQRDVS